MPVLRLRTFLVSACLLSLAGFVRTDPPKAEAPPPTDIVRNGKSATALVEVAGRGYGTAFCVHASGLFVTNEHVARAAGKGGTLTLVLHPGLGEQRLLKAQVVRTDREADLALLRVTNGGTLAALPLGSVADIRELSDVTAFGYPFGKALALDRKEYPAVSVNHGQVTSLRRKGGKLERIQLDVALNPGNSGGPVLDQKGRVVGVVVSGVLGARVNFAIPVGHLRRFLEAPALALHLPALRHADLHKPVVFEAHADSVLPSGNPLALELILASEAGGARRLKMQRVKESYQVRTEAVPPPSGPTRLAVTFRFSAGSVQGSVLDQPLRMGERKLNLREVRSLSLRPQPRAVLQSGQVVEGALAGLDELVVQLGEETLRLSLARVVQVAVQPPPTVASISCTLVALRDGKEVARLQESLAVGGLPEAGTGEPAAVAILPALLEKETVVRNLPAPVSDVAVGGGGRYLFLLTPRINALQVFDFTDARIVKAIRVPDATVKFAAGMDKLLIAHPASRTIQRWNLTTFEREQSAVLGGKGTIYTLAMGSASAGPMFVGGVEGPGDTFRAMITFLDVALLKPLPIKIKDRHGAGFGGPLPVRASADGRVFGMWGQGGSPQQIQLVILEGGAARVVYSGASPGAVVPAPDGQVIFTSRGGLFTPEVKLVEGSDKDGRGCCVPALQGPYYLALRAFRGDLPEKERQGLGLYLAGDARPIVALPSVKELDREPDVWGRSRLTLDRRLFLIPEARLLVVLPPGEDRLMLHRFDPDDALAKSGLDYLVVTSRPPGLAVRGDVYSYAIAVKSRKGGSRCQLLTGPEGMTVSEAGRVTWPVPAAAPAGEHPVVVSIRDGSGREVFHSFAVRIRE
jgi:hypothetical protein